MMNRTILFITTVAFATSTALAHPGHGGAVDPAAGNTVSHYLSEPFHAVGPLGVALLIIAGGVYWIRQVHPMRDSRSW